MLNADSAFLRFGLFSGRFEKSKAGTKRNGMGTAAGTAAPHFQPFLGVFSKTSECPPALNNRGNHCHSGDGAQGSHPNDPPPIGGGGHGVVAVDRDPFPVPGLN